MFFGGKVTFQITNMLCMINGGETLGARISYKWLVLGLQIFSIFICYDKFHVTMWICDLLTFVCSQNYGDRMVLESSNNKLNYHICLLKQNITTAWTLNQRLLGWLCGTCILALHCMQCSPLDSFCRAVRKSVNFSSFQPSFDELLTNFCNNHSC